MRLQFLAFRVAFAGAGMRSIVSRCSGTGRRSRRPCALTGGKSPKRRWLLVLAAVVVVLAAHALGVWYGNNVSIATDSRPKKSTLALEIVRPPKPLPKIEPPPPPPENSPQGATTDPDRRRRSE